MFNSALILFYTSWHDIPKSSAIWLISTRRYEAQDRESFLMFSWVVTTVRTSSWQDCLPDFPEISTKSWWWVDLLQSQVFLLIELYFDTDVWLNRRQQVRSCNLVVCLYVSASTICSACRGVGSGTTISALVTRYLAGYEKRFQWASE